VFQKLVSHNEDIQRLVEKGYAIAFDSNCMVIRDIPYLDDQKQLQIRCNRNEIGFCGSRTGHSGRSPDFFTGSIPHGLNGTPIPNLAGGPAHFALSDACGDVVVQRSFSNKPRSSGKFQDFFEKIENYVGIISGPAIELHGANPYTFRIVTDTMPDIDI